MSYQLIYDANNAVTGVVYLGQPLPYEQQTETFDETNPLVIALREWELVNNIDLLAWSKRDIAQEEKTIVRTSTEGEFYDYVPQTGDRWIEKYTDKQIVEEWICKGNYWFGREKEIQFNHVNLNGDRKIILSVDKEFDLNLVSLDLDFYVDGRNQSSRYWKFTLFRVSNAYNFVEIATTDSLSAGGNKQGSLKVVLNQQDLVALNNTLYYVLEADKIGTAGKLSVSGRLKYRFTKEV